MKSIAILYPGDMGSAVARLLVANGCDVFSYVKDRSARTRRLSKESGVQCLETFDEVVAKSDIVISLVSQESVIAVAAGFADSATRSGKRPIYIDGNSISPGTMKIVFETVSVAGADCVDGVFVGNSNMLGGMTTLYLSGAKAESLIDVFTPSFRAKTLGRQIGLASAFKLSVSPFNKGLVAMYLQAHMAAVRIGQADEFVRCLKLFYPETVGTVERLLPSYPRHVARRIQEMDEVCDWLDSMKHCHVMADGTKSILEKFLELELDPDRNWSAEEIMEVIGQRKFLDGG